MQTTIRRFAASAASVVLLGALAGCGGDDSESASDPAGSSSAAPSDDATSEAALPDWAPVIETDAADSVTGLDFSETPEPGDELEFAIVREGDGPEVEQGQTITANYYGSLYDSDQPFDESYSSQPFQAPIGVGSLIAGWDQTLPGVPVGSRVIMSVPSDLGYGDAGSPPTIPGGATLYFVIDILDAA